MPPRNFNLILFAVVTSVLCHLTYRSVRTAGIVGEAIEVIEQSYVDPVDRQTLLTSAMEGVVSRLDEHSSYFEVDAYSSFKDSIHQEFAGIGIYVDQPDPELPVRVLTPLVGSPALEAGMLPGDLIVAVDGEDVSEMTLPEVSERLKGPAGTMVSVVVRRGEEDAPERLTMKVRRATIELESVVGDHRDEANRWVYRLEDRPEVAYIRLKSFGDKTVHELESVLAELNNDFDALVLDLRANGGGLLYAACDVSDMFLQSGQIVSTRVRGGRIDESYAATPGTLVDPAKPLAILIDEDSASASEIVAACLQDNGRATIVGMRSYGKGTVQEIVPLQYGRSALRLTVARYFRPNNKNIHRDADATAEDEWGVTPDTGFVIPMDFASRMKLELRWRAASFPMLAGIDPPELEAIDAALEPNTESVDGEPAEGDRPGQVSPAEQDDRVSLSSLAKENVAQGPNTLEYDPPLRAAVGKLLSQVRPAGRSSGGAGGGV